MLVPKIEIPKQYSLHKNKSTSSLERFPFYLKECGFCSERKFEVGKTHAYSDILILYSLSGVVRYSKNTSTTYIQPHHVIISACNTPLYFTRTSSQWEFFYIIITGSHTKLYYNLIRNRSDILAINPLTPILQYFTELLHMEHTSDDLSVVEDCLLIHRILHELYTVTYDVTKAKAHTPVQETDINTVLKFISKNYYRDLTIDTICQEVNFSKYYFCKLFKAHMGLSIYQYVNEFRINKSKELLSYTKLSINAVATEVGFKNALTYIRCFKNSMNMTPSEYRKYY